MTPIQNPKLQAATTRSSGASVERISTGVAPLDRAKTVPRVGEQLTSLAKDWCLVATSSVGAGVHFGQAFPESYGLINLLQTAGRVSRGGECAEPAVSRIITADTRTVLVRQELIARFLAFDQKQFPTPREVMCYSVQVWENKLRDLPVTPLLGYGPELVGIQPECYDGFLGYMKGLIPLLEVQRNGGFVL